jgi:hypothetical protein
MIKLLALLFTVSALFAVGCSTHSPADKGNDSTNSTDLGIVNLTANKPKHVNLGDGKNCTLTAAFLDHDHLQVAIATDVKLAQGDTPPGMPAGTPVKQIQTMNVPSGREITVFVHHKKVRFTPNLKG